MIPGKIATEEDVLELLRSLLDEQGLSLSELARRTEVHGPSYYTDLFGGRKKLRWDHIHHIVDALGLDQASFFSVLYAGLPARPELKPRQRQGAQDDAGSEDESALPSAVPGFTRGQLAALIDERIELALAALRAERERERQVEALLAAEEAEAEGGVDEDAEEEADEAEEADAVEPDEAPEDPAGA